MSLDSLDDNKRIKNEFSKIRNKSKAPSFAMQYGSGPGKVQQLLKCSRQKAEQVYKAYHGLYSGLSTFADNNKAFGIRNGYVIGAFGLRLRTPILARHKIGSRESTEVGTEARSASNMVTQSWGMLMNRAFNEFSDIIEENGMSSQVILTNTIHDATYGICRATPEVVKFVNDNLVKCMQWQDGAIASDEVKMEAEVDFGTRWDNQQTLKNNQNLQEISEFIQSLYAA